MSETIKNAANYAAETLQSLNITANNATSNAPKLTADSNDDATARSEGSGQKTGSSSGNVSDQPGLDMGNSAYNEHVKSDDTAVTGTGGLNTGPWDDKFEAAPEDRGEPTTVQERQRGAGLEGGVPEPAVTSRNEAHWDPEATGDKEMVHEKSEMERELLEKVPEKPATTEENASIANNTGSVGGGVGSSAGVSATRTGGDSFGGFSHGAGGSETDIVTGEDGRWTYAPDGHSGRDAARESQDGYARSSGRATGEGNDPAQSTGFGNGAGLSSTAQETSDVNANGANNASTRGTDSRPAVPSTDASEDPRAGDPASRQAEGGVDRKDGENRPGGAKAGTHRENPSAIPFAGGERVGEKHWGESQILKE